MKIYIVTLFPKMFDGPLTESILYNATKKKMVEINIISLRDYGIGKRKTVDDTPYGGGAGMVLKPEPLFAAIESIRSKNNKTKIILLTPRGKTYSQQIAKKLSLQEEVILVCGHYEGVDERVNEIVDQEISIGDFILTGGEIPAMAVVDSIVRLLPGVLGDDRSAEEESFSHGILEYPQYTRPEEFRGQKVPKQLLSGNHQQIKNWRKEQAIEKTRKNRPDLLEF
jgi:tRNA (guanine37-N1)-methyltransferase